MGSRLIIALVLGLGACAAAGAPGSGGDDDPGPGPGSGPGAVDAAVPVDACPDTDGDGTCDALDACPGFDDRLDSDADTIADGCDVCPGKDDRADVNANTVPDCTELATRTVNLKVVGGNLWRGWHSSSTTSPHTQANENTVTGLIGATTYNSYYVFALTGFTASTIVSVTLELQPDLYAASDASETLSVWDVTTPSTTLETTGGNATTFTDLQSGQMYATFTVTSAQINSILSIPLSQQAAVDATAKLGGDFVVGLHNDVPAGYVRFGHTPAESPLLVARVKLEYLP